jgi:galactokinase
LFDQAGTIDGVLGARMMGGEFGGCSINLPHKSTIETFQLEMKLRYQNRFDRTSLQYEVNIEEGTGVV